MDKTDESTIYFEDIEPGTITDCGSTTVSKRSITEFAEEFDPLPIHTDEEMATEGPYSGIIASGYHTLCLSVRLLVDKIRSQRAVIAGLGIDSVTWRAPVQPGDTLSVRNKVVDTRRSESDPTRGIVHEIISVTNQNEETVLSYENNELVECATEYY